jgi:hypothetical protein
MAVGAYNEFCMSCDLIDGYVHPPSNSAKAITGTDVNDMRSLVDGDGSDNAIAVRIGMNHDGMHASMQEDGVSGDNGSDSLPVIVEDWNSTSRPQSSSDGNRIQIDNRNDSKANNDNLKSHGNNNNNTSNKTKAKSHSSHPTFVDKPLTPQPPSSNSRPPSPSRPHSKSNSIHDSDDTHANQPTLEDVKTSSNSKPMPIAINKQNNARRNTKVDKYASKGFTRVEEDMAFIGNCITGPRHQFNGKRYLNRFQFLDVLIVIAK